MSALREKLTARGIAEAADAAGWVETTMYGEPGWAFPLHGATGNVHRLPDGRTAQRWKAYAPNATRKYMWGYEDQKRGDLRQPEHCRYYWIGGADMREIIQDNDGVLHITAGEPDALTLYAMGYRNVTSFFGEGNVPATLPDDLERLGVREVHYYADNDNAGYDAAMKVRDALKTTLITCTLYAAPSEHNDLNDLYVANKHDTEATHTALRTIAAGESTPSVTAADANFDVTAYVSAVTSALGATWKRHRNGWSEPMACIFADHEYDNRRPAAGWNETAQSYRCFKCGRTYDIDKVAERLNIRKADYWTQPTLPATTAPTTAPGQVAPQVDDYIKSSDQGLSRLLGRLEGEALSDAPPIINPISELHPLGGFCRLLKPGKMIGILGLSGGGKTSFMESMFVDPLRQVGVSSLWWGPEWSWEEYTDRAVQRYSRNVTMEDIALHEMFLQEELARKAGKPATRFGKRLGDEQIADITNTVATIGGWSGKSYYVNKMELSLEQLLEIQRMKIEQLRAQGVNLRLVIYDYVQLVEVVGARSERERIQAAVNKIKAFVVDHGLIGVIASQPTKAASAEAKAAGDTLDEDGHMHNLQAEAAQFVRDWAFNLFVTLTPAVYLGNNQNWGRVNVVKNSQGTTGYVDLQTDFTRLRWLDKRRWRGNSKELKAVGD